MDTSIEKLNWHYETLPPETKKALDFLSTEKWLENSNWYLAGGTALALQSGNRKSVDLDFFTTSRDFDEKSLLTNFIRNTDWQTSVEEKNTIYGVLYGAKVSFIAYPFFVPKLTMNLHGTISVLAPIDIAVMKIIAVSQRGRKRDFFDLYWCAKNIESLDNLIKKLKEQYPSVAHDYNHILKSLVYFEDAESDPEPEIYFKANWLEIKGFLFLYVRLGTNLIFTKHIPYTHRDNKR
jgi:predicted nucleotidyltransferase component of viral defense system